MAGVNRFGSRRVRLRGGFGLWGWLCVVVCGLLLAAGCRSGGSSGGQGDGGVVSGGDSGEGDGAEGDGAEEVVGLLDSSGCSDGSWLEDASAGAVSDCEALVGLRNRVAGGRVRSEVPRVFDGIDGDEFWVWGNSSVDRWRGVELDEDGRVVELELYIGSGAVSVPEEIVELSELRELYLGGHSFSGELPEGFGGLSKLEVLFLGGNDFTEIPSEVFELKNLRDFRASSNDIERIPAEIGRMVELKVLVLPDNRLRGSIPAEIGNLVNLERLDLSTDSYYDGDNQLTGPIPPEIGNLARLEYLNLSGNRLSGSLPAEIGRLTSLEWMSLSDNELSGYIPAEIGNLVSVKELYLGGNALSGSIPPELGNLFDVVRLGLSHNELTGAIPLELGGLVSLEWLYLRNNNLCGEVPEVLYRLDDFFIQDNPRLGRSCVTGELLPIEDPLGCEVAYSPVTGECETPDTIPDGIG